MTLDTGRTTITVSTDVDLPALGARWRELETRAAPSFFQTWTWTGCLAAERFTAPVLVEAQDAGVTVALALFNRRGRTLFLGESGDPAIDNIYIEFNGILCERGRESALEAACLNRALGHGVRARRIVLSGVEGRVPPRARVRRESSAPFATLADGAEAWFARRSANTRQQLRRSARRYAESGPIGIERAATEADAHRVLDRLAEAHQAAWTARGKPGAFADPFFGRFHHALIALGFERGEIDLFTVAAGPRIIGYLYNFRHAGRSLAYQGGFDYASAAAVEKPGLTCHEQAIRYAAGWGAERYEFLAGDDRYKRSLSDGFDLLRWLVVPMRFWPVF